MRLELDRAEVHRGDSGAAPASPPTGRLGRLDRREMAEWSAYLLLLLVWAAFVLPARGGWSPYTVAVGTLAAVPSLLVLRPWRVCPRWLCGVAVAPAAASVLIASLTPFGDGGPVTVGKWGYAAAVLLATASFARTPARRRAVLVVLLLVGLHQYVQAWLPWWGGDDGATRAMTGELYSANPFGGMMLAFSLAAGSLVVVGAGSVRRLAWLVAPLTACGVVLSAARAAMLLLVVGLVLLALLGARVGGRRGLGRAALLAALIWGTLTVTTSTVFFEAGSGAFGGTAAKQDSGQTLDSTSGIRVDFWSAAWTQFLGNPVAGDGIGSYSGASRELMVGAAQRSPFAHNEILGSLAEGGLLLGLPVLVLLLGLGLAASRVLLRGARGGLLEPERAAAALAAGGLLVHSMLDFPLSFPGVLALFCLLGGVVVAPGSSGATGRATAATSRSARALAAAALLAVVLAGGYVSVGHDRAGVANRAGVHAVDPAGDLVRASWAGLRDSRLTVARGRALAQAAAPDAAVLEAVERDLRPLGEVDVALLALRADLQAAQGRDDQALATARRAALRARDRAPLLLTTYAERLAADGRRDEAFDLLAVEAYRAAEAQGRLRAMAVELLGQAGRVGGRPEPGWSCALARLQEHGEVPDALGGSSAPGPAPAGCRSWETQAAAILGDER